MKTWLNLLFVLCLLPTFATAEVAESFSIEAAPQSGVASNTAIDCIAHGVSPTGIWTATAKGVNYSFDGGDTWSYYSDATGLPSNNLSALYSIGGRLWVATNHEEMISGDLHSLSDGLTYTDDNGATWTQINFGSDGLNIPYVWGGDRTIFDITGHVDPGFFNNRLTDNDANWLFFAAFAGGFLASQDGGITWRRIYASPADSVQFNTTTEAPSYRNRYFACAADTSHGDSLFVWGGTSGGVFQYVYSPPREKLYSHLINSVAFCDTCEDSDSLPIFIGGGNSFSRSTVSAGSFVSRFEIDGLPGKSISAITDVGGRLLAGTTDTIAGVSTGLVFSDDQGDSFAPVVLPEVQGANNTVTHFMSLADRVYMAAGQAGLFASTDTGMTWERILLDSVNLLSAKNAVYDMAMSGDTLMIGTDTGLVECTVDMGGELTETRYTPFEDGAASGARIICVAPQLYLDTLDNVDSTALWTVHRSVGEDGVPMVGRRSTYVEWDVVQIEGTDPPEYDSTFVDSSLVWAFYMVDTLVNDIGFIGDSAFVVGNAGIWFSPLGGAPNSRFSARQYVSDSIVVATMDNDIITLMETRGDYVVFGAVNAMAVSRDRGHSFRIIRPNTDSLAADVVINHTYIGSGFGLAGDFIPAVDVQYVDDGPARIWAGARPAVVGTTGISVGEYRTLTNGDGDSTGFGLDWKVLLDGEYAWNFAFDGDFVFAATNDGLLMHDGSRDDDGTLTAEWESIPFVDAASGEELVAAGTAVFGVAVVDSFLWAGTDDGTVRLKLNDLTSQRMFAKVDSTTAADEVYAYPVPFEPNLGQEVDFHFVVETAGHVTVEVYDYAMNLVARPIDNVFYDAGPHPDGSSQGLTWDGRNGSGDVVAVGVYYFKVEFDSGDTRWGKLAVMP